MNHKAKRKAFKKQYCLIGISLFLILLIEGLKSNTLWVEKYYSSVIYPGISYFYIILFSWLPFSVGDVVYAFISGVIVYNIFRLIQAAIKFNISKLKLYSLNLTSFISVLYVVFYLNWGLNYYRRPIEKKYGLEAYQINKDDFLSVLDRYIDITNNLRADLDLNDRSKDGVKLDIVDIVKKDTLLQDYLCKTQVHAKQPISSQLASYFTVSGYFNPFSLEVQVNQLIPKASFPFVLVHELSHQMGVGFEDECNFIAFLTLKNDKDIWYKYSAYYSAVEYLLQVLYADKELFQQYTEKLSEAVLEDYRYERQFWTSYRGWIDDLSGRFYNSFLQHNNQPEGLQRYSMMARLLVAWEIKHNQG